MTNQQIITATLTFDDVPSFDANAVGVELAAMFRDVGLDLKPNVQADTVDHRLQFSGQTLNVHIYREALNVVVMVSASQGQDTNSDPAKTGQAQRAACYNVVRALKVRLAPKSVNWADADMAKADRTSQRRQQKLHSAAPADDTAAERMNRIFGTVEGDGQSIHFDSSHLEALDPQKRLDISIEAVQSEHVYDAPQPAPTSRPSRREALRFPELVPVEIVLQENRRALFPCDAIELTQGSAQDETTNPSERTEADDLTARLTVYVLNTILLVLAFPVGFGMLIFNILGGENLRTTAHVMALTGMGTALANADLPLLNLI
jgi:hypothetical protein